jgi:hypothetical protein
MFTAQCNFDIDKGDEDVEMELIQMQCESVQIKFSVGGVPSPAVRLPKIFHFLAQYASVW